MNKSAARVVDIIELLAESKKPLTLAEIGGRLSLPKSSCFDIVYTLAERGLLEIEQGTQKTFRLGIKLFSLGSKVLEQTELTEVARPFLYRLARDTGETVYLAVEDKGEIIYVDKVESDNPIRSTLSVGSRNAMHITALGKALLAAWPAERIRKALGCEPFFAPTARSIKDYKVLEKELSITRLRGYAVDDREGGDFMRCVAAPIRDHKGVPAAALSVAALDSRLPPEKVEAVAGLVYEAAFGLSRRLGYTGEKLY